MESKIEVLSTVKIQNSPDLYKIVDSLNRTLKEKDLMFGLALDNEDKNKAIFTIYHTQRSEENEKVDIIIKFNCFNCIWNLYKSICYGDGTR